MQFVGGKSLGWEGTGSTTAISLTDLAGGIASAPAEGDVVIVAYGTGSTADRPRNMITSGYTAFTANLYSNAGGQDTNLRAWWKRMGATPDTSVTVGDTGSSDDAASVAIHVWRGVDPSVLEDVATVTATGTGIAQPNPPSITPGTSGAVVLGIGAGAALTMASFTSSDLANFVTAAFADVNDVAIGMGSIAWSGSGAVDPAQFGGGAGSNTNRTWAAITIALRPGEVAVEATGTSVGAASASGTGRAIVPSVASSIAAAVVAAIGAAILAATGVAAGTATANGAGRAVIAAVGTSAGAATVEGLSLSGSLGSAAGAATVEGVGRAIWPVSGGSDGSATTDGIGGAVLPALGTADGSAAVDGHAISFAVATGTASGAADAAGVSGAIVPVAGTAAGAATVAGLGDFLVVPNTAPERLLTIPGGASGRTMQLTGGLSARQLRITEEP